MGARLKAVFTSAAMSVLLMGCGNEDLALSQPQEGRFVDAPVSGLRYSAEGKYNFTETNGRFYYNPGYDYSFSIGKLVLGQVTLFHPNATVTPGSLAAPFPPNSRKDVMIGITRLLMTADLDVNPDNGIRIISSLDTEGGSWGDIPVSFVLDLAGNDAQRVLAGIRRTNAQPALTWVTEAKAKEHLAKSMLCAYSGAFYGELTNGDRVAMVLDGSGRVTTWQYTPESEDSGKLNRFSSQFSFSSLEADTTLNRVEIYDDASKAAEEDPDNPVTVSDSDKSWLRYSHDIRYPDYVGVSFKHGLSSFPAEDKPLERYGRASDTQRVFAGLVQTSFPFGRNYLYVVNIVSQNTARGYLLNMMTGTSAELSGNVILGRINVSTVLEGRKISLSGSLGGGTTPTWSASFHETFNAVVQTTGVVSVSGC